MPATPADPALYARVKRAVHKQYPKPSAYRSGILVQRYKKAFAREHPGRKKAYRGKYAPKKGLARWFREDWRNQRGEVGYRGKTDVYRPTRRVTAKTPLTFVELSPAELARARRKKGKTGRVARFRRARAPAKTKTKTKTKTKKGGRGGKPSLATARRWAKSLRGPEDLEALLPSARPLSWFRPGRTIHVSDKMQSRYAYRLEARPGKNFAPEFRPQVSPARMLRMGVFSGVYLNDCVLEYPREWFAGALRAKKLRPGAPDPKVNALGVKSRKSLKYWRQKGWIPAARGDPDVRGWFQWYCRYWLGRRDPRVDEVQIKRWKAFARHRGQILAAYRRGPRPRTRAQKREHRAKQRQALLQWAYNPWV